MGTWGSGPFDNDVAGDLLSAVQAGDYDIDDYASHPDGGYLDADDAQTAIAVAEILAVAHGVAPKPVQLDGIDAAGDVSTLSPEPKSWVLAALERAVSDSDTSELYELWEENGPEDLAAWRAPILSRLASLKTVG
ncbi:DUF4259 domain-containing protein [Rhodococcus sp. NyZ502]|uniref:DUF4259 domain-containing protein n=1 Tax=Rhodococcus sp. NyZ502 TaxID=3242855 RepID=UPI003557DFE6